MAPVVSDRQFRLELKSKTKKVRKSKLGIGKILGTNTKLKKINVKKKLQVRN
jgi:hypothetical protein